MANQKVLEGRVALVTGCGSASGIGFATARMLAMQGAKVAITSATGRIKDRARELKAACGADLWPRPPIYVTVRGLNL